MTWLSNDLFTGTYGALASSLLVLGVFWALCSPEGLYPDLKAGPKVHGVRPLPRKTHTKSALRPHF